MKRSLTSVDHTLLLLYHIAVTYFGLRLVQKAENNCSQSCNRKSLLTPGLSHKAASEQSVYILFPDDLLIKHTNYRMIFQALTLVKRVSSDPGFKKYIVEK